MNPAQKIQRILVPYDFGEPAQCALAYALVLADKLGARVTILHAYEIPAYGFPDAITDAFRMAPEIERHAAEALRKVAERARGSSGEIDTIVRSGATWAQILEVAKSLPADLIVMGTHGRTTLPRMLLGSVAEKVLRSARCPVLTVRAAQGATPS
jgi:nucleotide-binding universal stress UspA family protein